MAKVTIGGITIENGQRTRIELPAGRLPTQTPIHLPVEVVNGVHEGPRIWLSAALHGDELNGLEIIQRVLDRLRPASLHGEVVAAPIVNVFGFINRSRYLPDGRDLNRSFPGSARGSIAARLAHLFLTEIVGKCTHGIDLHTAGGHRVNLPQVRGDLTDAETRRMAEAFAAPIMIHGDSPKGSLRDVLAQRGVPCLVYEAGEPHRFNNDAIDIGVKGVLRVMAELGMIPRRREGRPRQCMEASERTWVRARRSGILRLNVHVGQSVVAGQRLGTIRDAFGDSHADVPAPAAGLVIGHNNHPMVSQGDAIIHLATGLVTHRV